MESVVREHQRRLALRARRLLAVATSILGCMILAACTAAEPPTLEEMVGAWKHSGSEAASATLELEADGAIALADVPAAIFETSGHPPLVGSVDLTGTCDMTLAAGVEIPFVYCVIDASEVIGPAFSTRLFVFKDAAGLRLGFLVRPWDEGSWFLFDESSE